MTSIKTTIKTDVCSFSDYRIYPGRGLKAVSKDGKLFFYFGGKQASLASSGKKAAKLTWTQTWRRNNKKVQTATTHKKKTHRKEKIKKAIEGLTLSELYTKQADHQAKKLQAQSAEAKKTSEAKKKLQSKIAQANDKFKSQQNSKMQSKMKQKQSSAAKTKNLGRLM